MIYLVISEISHIMKTKEEVIKEAYFELFDNDNLNDKENRFLSIKNWIDIFGWFSGNISNVDKKLIDISGHEIRPKSLQGLEDNNGWICIESEDDLPKDSFNYYLHCNDGRLLDMKEYDYYKKYIVPELKATHYQPIVKPKPPLY